ncbi:MAG: hypothetical protein KDI36_02810 [Pseudomonadales bacterium]|nr:hypothetical protein [Pseudomonadales bacterium]
MKRLMILCLMTVASFAQASVRDEALNLLQGYEWELNEAQVQALGAAGKSALLDIAGDPSLAGFIRERAAASLSAFADDEVRKFYLDRLETTVSPTIRRRTVEALCETWDATSLESTLIPMLKSDDTRLKVIVANCLQSVDSDAARAALAEYRISIRDSWELNAAGFRKVN